YSPLKCFKLNKPGMHLGVVELGGIGHVAVKFAKALGLKVNVISTSPSKEKETIDYLGVDSFIVSRDQAQIKAILGTMNGIIGTVSALHSILPLIGLLKSHGKLVMVCLPHRSLKLVELHRGSRTSIRSD
ncbi:hypothetical protein GIB67_005623, partial [Kingdonia uniflora]